MSRKEATVVYLGTKKQKYQKPAYPGASSSKLPGTSQIRGESLQI